MENEVVLQKNKKIRNIHFRATEEEYQKLLVLQKTLGCATLSETVLQLLNKIKGLENLCYKSLKLNNELLNKKSGNKCQFGKRIISTKG